MYENHIDDCIILLIRIDAKVFPRQTPYLSNSPTHDFNLKFPKASRTFIPAQRHQNFVYKRAEEAQSKHAANQIIPIRLNAPPARALATSMITRPYKFPIYKTRNFPPQTRSDSPYSFPRGAKQKSAADKTPRRLSPGRKGRRRLYLGTRGRATGQQGKSSRPFSHFLRLSRLSFLSRARARARSVAFKEEEFSLRARGEGDGSEIRFCN